MINQPTWLNSTICHICKRIEQACPPEDFPRQALPYCFFRSLLFEMREPKEIQAVKYKHRAHHQAACLAIYSILVQLKLVVTQRLGAKVAAEVKGQREANLGICLIIPIQVSLSQISNWDKVVLMDKLLKLSCMVQQRLIKYCRLL